MSLSQQSVTTEVSPITHNVTVTVSNARGPAGDAGGGGGATEYGDLTDAATVDLPAVNGPLGEALDEKGNLSGGNTWDGGQTFSDYVDFTPGAAPAHQEGRVFYDETDHSLTYYNEQSEVSQNLGREMWCRVRNASGATILNGKAVYITGAVGQFPSIGLARADADATSRMIGIATHDIENNTFGYVTVIGEVKGLDLSAFTDGAELYLSASTAGALTATAPTAPNLVVRVGVVEHAHATQGKLYVHPEMLSVSATRIYDASTATWTFGGGAYSFSSESGAVFNGGITYGSSATFTFDSAAASSFRTAAGLAIGTNVQAYDADLSSWGGVARASGFDTFAATPSSANLISLLTDETGTGSAVFATSPTLTTPNIGAATGTSLSVSGSVTSTGGNVVASGDHTFTAGTVRLRSSGAGIFLVTNNSANDLSRIQLGGTTSSYPSIKRNGTTMESRLVDDSGYAPFTASNFTASGNLITTPDTRSGAGAVSVTTSCTKVTTTGAAQALTLANGTDGQIKTIIHDVDGGDFILTPTTATGYTTISSSTAGDSATLQYVTTRGWIILALRGATAA